MLLGGSRRSTVALVLAALMVAIGVLLVYLAVVSPVNRLFFLGAATLALLVVGVEGGVRLAVGAVVAAVLLVFLLLPVGPWTLAFAFFFGPYAVVKQFADRWPFWLRWLVKFLHFNVAAGAVIFALGGFSAVLSGGFPGRLPEWLPERSPIWLPVAGAQLVLVVFDLALSYFVGYYLHRFKPARKLR